MNIFDGIVDSLLSLFLNTLFGVPFTIAVFFAAPFQIQNYHEFQGNDWVSFAIPVLTSLGCIALLLRKQITYAVVLFCLGCAAFALCNFIYYRYILGEGTSGDNGPLLFYPAAAIFLIIFAIVYLRVKFHK